MVKIYSQFIPNDSLFSLNIPSTIRKTTTEKFKSVSIEHVFDEVIEHVEQVLIKKWKKFKPSIKKGPSTNVIHLLKNEIERKLFKEYAKQELSAENIEFWEMTEKWRKMPKGKAKVLKNIYQILIYRMR